MKYTLVTMAGIHSRIAKETDVPGYTECILEIGFPSDEELKVWSNKQNKKWILENNERMKSICNFLNSNV